MHKLCDSMAQVMQLAKLKLPEKCTETITQKNTAFPIVLFHSKYLQIDHLKYTQGHASCRQ